MKSEREQREREQNLDDGSCWYQIHSREGISVCVCVKEWSGEERVCVGGEGGGEREVSRERTT